MSKEELAIIPGKGTNVAQFLWALTKSDTLFAKARTTSLSPMQKVIFNENPRPSLIWHLLGLGPKDTSGGSTILGALFSGAQHLSKVPSRSDSDKAVEEK